MTQVIEQKALGAQAPPIKFLSETEVRVKALIYGDSGIGKTYLLGTAPKVLMLLTEPEVSRPALMLLGQTKGIDIATWEINTWDDIGEAYGYLAAGDHDFETVALDGLTDMNMKCIQAVKQDAVIRAGIKGRERDADMIELSDWQRIGDRMRSMITAFRDLPMHVLMSALVTEIRQEQKYVPYLQPQKLATGIQQYFNMVGYYGATQDNEGKALRRMLLAPDPIYTTKNPGGSLPDVVESPDFAAIIPQIVAALTKKGDKN